MGIHVVGFGVIWSCGEYVGAVWWECGWRDEEGVGNAEKEQ